MPVLIVRVEGSAICTLSPDGTHRNHGPFKGGGKDGFMGEVISMQIKTALDFLDELLLPPAGGRSQT